MCTCVSSGRGLGSIVAGTTGNFVSHLMWGLGADFLWESDKGLPL